MKRLSLLLAAFLATSGHAATIAITGGTVLTAVGETSIANGTVIVRDGRIVAVGAGFCVFGGG